MEAAKLAVAGLVRPENPEVDPGAIGHEQPTKADCERGNGTAVRFVAGSALL